MDESGKSRRVETCEFWEEAIRLWAESGLPVREFVLVKAGGAYVLFMAS